MELMLVLMVCFSNTIMDNGYLHLFRAMNKYRRYYVVNIGMVGVIGIDVLGELRAQKGQKL